MSSNFRKTVAIGFLCGMIALSGCGGSPPINQSTNTTTPSLSTTHPPSSLTHTSENPTRTPAKRTGAPEGLLIVEIAQNRTESNGSEIVQYNQTRFNQAPTLNEAVTAAVSTNSTQTRDLSSQEVKQIESVADEYNKPTGGFTVLKNGTAVHISLGYEI